MNEIPQRCTYCDRYCDGCPMSRVIEENPLDVARGIAFALVLSAAAWGLLLGLLVAAHYGGLL